MTDIHQTKPKRIGYARVSTADQNLSLQHDALKLASCDVIYDDHGLSGVHDERSGLNQALSALNENDVLVVWKLDRLGRSLRFLCELSEDLAQRNIGLHSICDGINTTTSSGKLVFHIMGALAEFERSLISERTKAGMAAAKMRGVHVGRPRTR